MITHNFLSKMHCDFKSYKIESLLMFFLRQRSPKNEVHWTLQSTLKIVTLWWFLCCICEILLGKRQKLMIFSLFITQFEYF